MKIAILGWGSLVWNWHDAPIVGGWELGGPVLRIEFSRISDNGRLTLVIDESNGIPVATRYARSNRRNLDEAIGDLRKREKTSSEFIGYVNLVNGKERASARDDHPNACNAINTWAIAQGWDAVIWTALHENFARKRDESFSSEAALRYLEGLTGEARQQAFEYLTKAPPEVLTPVRVLFNQNHPN